MQCAFESKDMVNGGSKGRESWWPGYTTGQQPLFSYLGETFPCTVRSTETRSRLTKPVKKKKEASR